MSVYPDLEILEYVANPGALLGPTVPTVFRINGTEVAVAADTGVAVAQFSGRDVLAVTVTLLARSVTIGPARRPDPVDLWA